MLKVTLACGAVGWGEASPLPGLHAESTEEAGAQLRVVAALLDGGGVDGRGVRVPAELPLLGGAVGAWLRDVVGVRAANALAPSVRFAVESAALGALANASGEKKKTLAETLLRGAATFPAAEMNALVGDAANTPEKSRGGGDVSRRRGSHVLETQGCARGDGAEGARADAARLLAVRRAVGPDVRLRADANRRWSLNDALTFGLQVADANLEYVEEPVACLEDLAAFHCTTGVPVALDESVDDATRRAMNAGASVAAATAEFFEPTFGVVALVLKPSVLGGFEPCAAAAAAARNRGVAAVVSAAFESGVGVAACAHLAAALDAAAADAAERFSDANSDDANSDDTNSDDANSDNSDSAPLGTPVARLAATPHGLGTGAWIDGDVCDPPCAPASRLEGAGVGVALHDAGFVAALTDAVSPACASATSWGVETFHEVSTRRGTYRFRMLDSDPDAWRRRRRRFCCTDSWARRRIGTPSPRASREPEDESSRWIFRRTAAPRSSATRRRGSRSKPSRTPSRDSSRERRRTRRKKRPGPGGDWIFARRARGASRGGGAPGRVSGRGVHRRVGGYSRRGARATRARTEMTRSPPRFATAGFSRLRDLGTAKGSSERSSRTRDGATG